MGKLLIRKIEDAVLAILQARAGARGACLGAIGREATRKEARLTVEEKLALVAQMQEASKQAMVPGVEQTPSWVLIRETRDTGY